MSMGKDARAIFKYLSIRTTRMDESVVRKGASLEPSNEGEGGRKTRASHPTVTHRSPVSPYLRGGSVKATWCG
jgi:hypothetical protein